MSKTKRSVTALLMSVIIAGVFGLTACGGDKTPEDYWSYGGETLSYNVEIAEGDPRSLVVTYADDTFKETVENKQIKIVAYDLTETDAEAYEETVRDDTLELTNFTVARDSAKQLTLTLAAGADSGHWGYAVAVHQTANTSGKAGEGFVFESTEEELDPQETASVTGKYTTADVNPVITVELAGTTAAASISAQGVKLEGAFAPLTVTSVTGGGSTVTIHTSGRADAGISLTGRVLLAAEAVASGEALSASCNVDLVGAYVDAKSYEFSGNVLAFDIVLGGAEFAAASGDVLVSGDISLTVVAVSRSKTRAEVTTPVTAASLDEAVAAVAGKAVTIPADKLNGGGDLELLISASRARFGAEITYVEAAAGDTLRGYAVLFAENGTFDELTATDISVGGDFASASVESVEKDGDNYNVTFTFDAGHAADLDDIAFSGSVTLRAGALKNLWGTDGAETVCTIAYVTGEERSGEIEAVKAIIAANKGTLDTISTVGNVIGGVSSAANGIVSILQLCGVLESTDGKLDSIRDEIFTAQEMISQIGNKIDALGARLSAQLDTALMQGYKTLYNTAAANWNDFLSHYAQPLSDMLNNYKVAYNGYMLDYIANADTKEVTVYKNAAGDVTVPGTMPGYGVGINEEIVSSVAYTVSGGLSAIKSKVQANGGRLYKDYWKDISGYIKANHGTVILNHEGFTPEAYLNSLTLSAAYSALQSVGTENILNVFTNFCNKLAGRVGGQSPAASALKPLDYFYQMESVYYNFYSESAADITATRNWLTSLQATGFSMAVLAHRYTPAADADLVTKANAYAAAEIDKNTGVHSVAAGSQYSYVAGKTLTVKRATLNSTTTTVGRWPTIDGAEGEFYFPTSFMSKSDIDLMRSRYENLKSAGVTVSATFDAYLTAAGLIEKNMEGGYALTEKPVLEDIIKNNSVSIPVVYVHRGKWFKVGDKVAIGTHGKLSAKRFKNARQLTGEAYSLSGSDTQTLLYNSAVYYEPFIFSSDEDANMRYEFSVPLMVFTLS